LDSNQIIIPGCLVILVIGLIACLFYLFFINEEKANKNLAFKYLKRLTIAIMSLSFGFLTILTIFILIMIMARVTMALFGY
jgi:hypothetical protein